MKYAARVMALYRDGKQVQYVAALKRWQVIDRQSGRVYTTGRTQLEALTLYDEAQRNG